MGLWGDVAAAGLALPTGGGSLLINDAMKQRGQAPPPGATDPRRTDIPYRAANEDAKNFADNIYNDTNSLDYGSVFDQAYQRLGQPLHDNDRTQLYTSGTRSLAESFANRFYKQTNTLPTIDQVTQFVNENLNSPFAEKFILGMPPGQIDTMSDNYLQANPNLVAPKQQPNNVNADLNAVQTVKGLSEQLPGLYEGLSNQLGDVADTAFAAPRKSAIEDEAALGRLRSPASIGTIGAVDAAKANSLANARYGLGMQQLQGTQDLGKTLANVQQAQQGIQNQAQGIQNQATQFGQNLGLQRQGLSNFMDEQSYQRGLQRQGIDIASQLGRAKAGAESDNGLSGALGGAASGAGVGTQIGGPGWGTGIGALIGGLGGYFGSKR